jgi:uncharacterized membrane protein YphA (DoxX/SURF4 family)
MNWFGNQKSEGMEFFLLAIGLAGSLVISGAGRFSVDAFVYRAPTRPAALADYKAAIA